MDFPANESAVRTGEFPGNHAAGTGIYGHRLPGISRQGLGTKGPSMGLAGELKRDHLIAPLEICVHGPNIEIED